MRYRRGTSPAEARVYRRLPSVPSRHPGLDGYLADVCAVVFGNGLSRLQARWLAYRLLNQREEAAVPSRLILDEDTRRELRQIADDYLASRT